MRIWWPGPQNDCPLADSLLTGPPTKWVDILSFETVPKLIFLAKEIQCIKNVKNIKSPKWCDRFFSCLRNLFLTSISVTYQIDIDGRVWFSFKIKNRFMSLVMLPLCRDSMVLKYPYLCQPVKAMPLHLRVCGTLSWISFNQRWWFWIWRPVGTRNNEPPNAPLNKWKNKRERCLFYREE